MAPWGLRHPASIAAAVARPLRPAGSLRPAAEHLRCHRAHFQPIADLAGDSGSGWSSRVVQQQWAPLVGALPDYVEERGHGWVRKGYVTADGYAMGADAAKARRFARRERLGVADRATLIDAGFEWDYGDHRWAVTTAALQTYLDLHGDLRVPKGFVVPAKAHQWPEACWGMTLGETVCNIRSKQYFVKDRPERREWLDSVGFVWDELAHRWAEEVQPALQTYSDEHGHLRVSTGFVVPAKAPWPKACRGMRLGETVSNIRSKHHFVKGKPERREWLDSMGFVWTSMRVGGPRKGKPERCEWLGSDTGKPTVGSYASRK